MMIMYLKGPVYQVPLMLYMKELKNSIVRNDIILQGSDKRFSEDDAKW